jgi:hypothetical protein
MVCSVFSLGRGIRVLAARETIKQSGNVWSKVSAFGGTTTLLPCGGQLQV